MIFPYKEITPQIRRPIIPITIKSDTRFILYHGLIDSGADHCIFSLEIAKELGIKFSKENKLTFIGAGKEEIEGFWEENLKPWDMAAGSLLILEAGGFISDFKGEKNFLENGNVIAGNPKIYEALLNAVGKSEK